MGFSRKEYWNGLPCPPVGDLPDSGFEPTFMSPALAGEFFTPSTTWEAAYIKYIYVYKAMAPHSSTLAWKIPWMEEPGRLQSMVLLRVRHDRVTSLSLLTFMHWRRKCNPLQRSCLENPRDGGAWWAAVYGVSQSRT